MKKQFSIKIDNVVYKIWASSQEEAEQKAKEEREKNRRYYDVKVECMVPATFVYRILAYSPEEAEAKAYKLKPNGIKYHTDKKRKLKLFVYNSGSIILRLSKNINEK